MWEAISSLLAKFESAITIYEVPAQEELRVVREKSDGIITRKSAESRNGAALLLLVYCLNPVRVTLPMSMGRVPEPRAVQGLSGSARALLGQPVGPSPGGDRADAAGQPKTSSVLTGV